MDSVQKQRRSQRSSASVSPVSNSSWHIEISPGRWSFMDREDENAHHIMPHWKRIVGDAVPVSMLMLWDESLPF